TGFSTAAEFMKSSVEYRTMNVYDVDPEEIGTFDIIFFLGVLYHLRAPLLALDRLSEVAKPGSTIWVESHVIDRGFVDPKTQEFRKLASIAPNLVDVPMAQFYPDRLLAENPTNWWGPNLAGLKAMVESAGFEILRSRLIGTRGLVVARKVDDAEITFYRNFDREEMTGDEGMAWEDVKKWIETKKTREAARRRDRSSQPEDA
ncbi:MAG TPA: DUF1698 domain-containing protein, partial [Gammaproteobacteria bacterium]|nr:DUF1698 domain-containing protein [Gammaproteobacteria bacterium]